MRSIGVCLCLAGLVLAQGIVSSQATRPDFSGTWQIDPEQSGTAADGATAGPTTLVITQTGNSLSLDARRANGQEHLIFRFDGSSTPLPGDVTTTSRWTGASLVSQTVRTISGMTVTVRETWALNPGGNTLTLDRVTTVEHGYETSTRDPNNYGTSKQVFTKVVR